MSTSDLDKHPSSAPIVGRQPLLEAEMRSLAIAEERHTKYRYGDFVYDNLESAMAYARLERDRNRLPSA